MALLLLFFHTKGYGKSKTTGYLYLRSSDRPQLYIYIYIGIIFKIFSVSMLLGWDLRLNPEETSQICRFCITVYVTHLKPVLTYLSNSCFYFISFKMCCHISAMPCFRRIYRKGAFLLCCQICQYFPFLVLTLVQLLKSLSLLHIIKFSSAILSNTFIGEDMP